MKSIRKKNKWPYLFCLPFLLTYAIFNLYPMLYSLNLSFYEWNGIGVGKFAGLDNYITLWTKDPLFLKSIGNTVILMGLSTPITVFLGMLVAHLLFNIGKGRRLYQTVNFFPYITTPVAIGFIFSYMFDSQSGYINKALTALGIMEENYYWLQNEWAVKIIIVIMIVWRYLGYYMTIYLAAMTALPQEIYEAADVDGANSVQRFFEITIPMLKNTTVFLVITSVIGGLQMFEEPKLLFNGWGGVGLGSAGGPGNSGLTTIWKFYNDAFYLDSKLGYGAAIAYSLFMVILVFSIAGFRVMNRKERERE